MSMLPNGKVKASYVNPKVLVIYGKTKQGKTTVVANLEDNLILDLEGGTRFYNCLKIDIVEEAEKSKSTQWQALVEVVKELKAKKAETGKYPYKFITVDTIGHLEGVIMPYAMSLYKSTPVGKTFKGDAVAFKALPNGAAWGPIREAFFNTIAMLNLYCEHLILIAHTKGVSVKRRGEEMTIEDIDVSGKMSQMVAGQSDAVALIYRNKNQTILDFSSNERVAAGARNEHLREKAIVVCESDNENNLSFFWDRVFV